MKHILLTLAAFAAVTAAAPAMADEALAKSKNCFACHATDKKVVGPSFKDVAAKFGKEAGAADMLAEKIVKGSKGVWGPVPMPPNTSVKPDEAKKLAQWVLSIK